MTPGLPSKKIVFLVLACTIGVGIVSFAAFARKNNSDKGLVASQNVELVEKALKQSSTIDDDQDGLANWEETLWGTNPKKADTDNDGKKDGDEVAEDRDPAKAGPNDMLATASTVARTKSSTGGTNGSATIESATSQAEAKKNVVLENTQTAKISRDLFATYLQAKRQGLPISADIMNQIVQQAVSDQGSASAKQYTYANIVTNNGSDLKKYGNDLGEALYTGQTQNKTTTISEMDIVNSAVEKENAEEIKKLDPIIANYSAILNKSLKVSVPNEIAGQHIAFINSVSRVLGDIQNLRKMFDDPVAGLAGISSYYADVEALRSAIANIEYALSNKGVTFENGEYGYIFTQTI